MMEWTLSEDVSQTQSSISQSKPVSSRPTTNHASLAIQKSIKIILAFVQHDLFSMLTLLTQYLWTETYGVEYSQPNALSDAQSNEDMIAIKSKDWILSGVTMKGYEVHFYVVQGLSNSHGNCTRIHIFLR